MHYGHRRDVAGYARCLQAFDERLPEILRAMHMDDVLIITADHGNDPTFKGTDHTREYIPLLVYNDYFADGLDLGTLSSFADIGATIATLLGVDAQLDGQSFAPQLLPTYIE
jgi:phosphopentomutase